MADYKEMYYKLFKATSEAIEILQQAQTDTEEMYIDSDDTALFLMENVDLTDED